MLEEIRVENLLIIDELEAAFHPGLNVISGETGVGKSLLLGAVGCLFGARIEVTDAETREVRVEGRFRLAPEDGEILPEDLRREATDDLVIRVTKRPGGSQRCQVNGSLVSRQELKELGARLVDVHGQRDMQRLLSEREQVLVLDRFAGTTEAARSFAQLFGEERRLRDLITRRDERAREVEERLELIGFQVEELEAAGLRSGERDAAFARRKLVARAAETARLLGLAAEALGSESESRSHLLRAASQLERSDGEDPELAGLVARAFEIVANQDELARDLLAQAARHERIDDDPAALDERLQLITSLERKHRRDESGLIELQAELRAEKERLGAEREELGDLDARHRVTREKLETEGRALAEARHQAGLRLAKAVEAELRELRMPDAELRIESGRESAIAESPLGLGRPRFMIRTNPGQPFASLDDCASGGELSRLLLAMKSVLAATHRMPLLIFDEIESGIGPRLGAILGRKLAGLARHRQVICITHLPQIAAHADRQFRIDKVVRNENTIATLEVLEGKHRVEELAAMLGGGDMALARRQAKALIEVAQKSDDGAEAAG